jgi:predicted Zn-dependent protease
MTLHKIKPPDSFHLDAAQGWVGLGNNAEARAELAHLPERLQDHPAVLEVRWAIAASDNDWTVALEIARQAIQACPEDPFGMVHQAYALRRMPGCGLQAAWDALFPAMERFPKDPIIPYNLACYAAQMDQVDHARILFARALAIGKKDQLRQMALNDPDLEPLWKEIAAM